MDEPDRVEPEQLATALAELQRFFDQQGWQYCLVGGLAAAYWGQPRYTKHIDVVLLTGFGDEQHFIKPMTKRFQTRTKDAARFALRNRVLLLNTPQGVPIDVSLGAIPFEEEMLKRAKAIEVLPGVSVRTASPEDIVIMKAIAGRPRDVDDIQRIIAVQGRKLDVDYIRRWLGDLAQFCVEMDVLDVFKQAFQTVKHQMKLVPRPQRPRRKRGE